MPTPRKLKLRPFAAILALSGAASAQPPPEAADLGWLAGHWCGQAGPARIEEHWLAPAHGELLGISRTTRDGRMVDFEYLRVARTDGMTAYVAQPRGRPPTTFKLEASGDAWVRFANPQHDFPQRIEYRRDGTALTATISGPGHDGKEQSMSFEFATCKAETAKPGE